jgi:serine/threonine protein kinase
VYRVEESLGSRVVSLACKEMHVMDDPDSRLDEREDALRMFQEEAYLLSTLRNPHIPSAHFERERAVWLACPICGRSFKGVRQCPDHGSELAIIRERYYLVMDFLDGLDLDQVVTAAGRPLAEERVLDWTLQVCSALEAVHAKGFSHRDIKPANIKIQRDGAPPASTSSTSSTSTPPFTFADGVSVEEAEGLEGRAMLIDFGLVKPSAAAGKYGTMVLGSGPVLGSNGYAPPNLDEQAAPDARADIHALGMTMYRLLTARDPSEPSDLEAMRRGRPRDFNPALSAMAESIVLKASAPDRAARYEDVGALKADLLAARYPIETRCPHCSHAQRSLQPPGPDSRCERCGRPLLAPGAAQAPAPPASTSSSTSAPARGKASSPAPPPWKRSPGADPRLPRIDQVRQALLQAPAPGVTGSAAPDAGPEAAALRARLAEIGAVLARASKYAPGTPEECPACRQKTLREVRGAPDGSCPLCRAARLAPRDNTLPACPVCRQGALPEFALRPGELFCPICREVPLSPVERKSFLGLAVDDRWACSNCQAEWDVRGRDAVLESAPSDPYGVAAQLKGQQLPDTQWQGMSGRAERWFACDACDSQFEPRKAEALALMHVGDDPHGVGAAFKGRELPRGAWARIARGLPAEDATHDCPACKAAWLLDRGGSMALVRAGEALPPWAGPLAGRTLPLAGRTLPLSSWYCLSEGKASPHPGVLCSNADCQSEWNSEAAAWSLAATLDPRMGPFLGQVASAESWRRRAQGLPEAAEIARLKQEEAAARARLALLEEQAQVSARRKDQQSREAMRTELAGLLGASALEGHVRLQRMAPAKSAEDWRHQLGTFVVLPLQVAKMALRASEALRWEGTATLCSANFDDTRRGYVLARREAGVLVVTDERLQFVNLLNDRPIQIWECALPLLLRAFTVVVSPNTPGESTVVIVEHRPSLSGPPPRIGSPAPSSQAVGFEVAPATWVAKCDSELLRFRVDANDLAALIERLKP